MSSSNSGSLSLVGDVMIEHQSIVDRLTTHAGFKAAIANLNEDDLQFINLEMPLSTRGYRVRKHTNLRSNPKVIEDIKALGTDAVALANNHMMDFGPEAMVDTLTTCVAAGLAISGAGSDLEEAMQPAVLHGRGVSIGLLSFSSTLPVESDAGVGKPGIAPIRVNFSLEIETNLMAEQPGTMPVVHSWADEDDVDLAVAAIQKLKAEVDVVVVALHWGVPAYWLSPYQGLLAEYQQPLARTLIDAGADLIWGHHSHTLHPIEVYKRKPIFYSLGNFIFENPRPFMEPESVIVHVKSLVPLEIELSPILVDDDGFPLLAEGDRGALVMKRLEEISAEFGTRFVWQGNRIKVDLGSE